MPKYISSYYKQNQLRSFSYQRVYRKGPKSDNEFVNLWLEVTHVTCEHPLPYVLNRSVIIDSAQLQLSPVETAINSLDEKYDALFDLFTEFDSVKSTSQVNVNPLTMSLLGVIDAAVQGGMDKYQECFFIPSYVAGFPHEKENLERLQSSIKRILEVVDVGLGIHGRLCPTDLRPLQARMEEQLFGLRKKNGLLAADAIFTPKKFDERASISSNSSLSSLAPRANSHTSRQLTRAHSTQRSRMDSSESKISEVQRIASQDSASTLHSQSSVVATPTVGFVRLITP